MFLENPSVMIALNYNNKELLKYIKENITLLKNHNRKKLIEKAIDVCSKEEIFTLLKYSFEYDELCESIITRLCLTPLTNEMCKVIPMYLSKMKNLSIISNLPDENIKSLLSGLVSISDYNTALKIIVDNDLDSKFLNSFVNDVILQNDVFNSMHNSNNTYSLYIVLNNIARLNYLHLFSYNVSSFCKDLEDRIIASGDIDTIIECSIFLDKSLFYQIFPSKSKLIEYMVLNEYPNEKIEMIKNIIYMKNDKSEINRRVKEKIEKLKVEFPIDNSRVFYYSKKDNNNMITY